MKSYAELKALIEQRGVHAEFGDPGESWGIEQNSFELATFLCRMQELGVQSVLEIGTGYKGGLSRFLAADMGWTVTSVDIQDYGHSFEGVEYLSVNNLPRNLFERWNYDLVFIDGDHSYESVSHDEFYYGQLATKVIAFHDIAGLRDCEGVMHFWEETHGNTKLKTMFVVSHNANPAGIGWIEL